MLRPNPIFTFGVIAILAFGLAVTAYDVSMILLRPVVPHIAPYFAFMSP